MKIPSFAFILQSLLYVIRRFPFAILAAIVGAAATMFMIEEVKDPSNVFPKIMVTAALGLPVFLCANLISEKWQLSSWRKWVSVLIAAVLLLLHYFTLDFIDDNPGLTFIMRFAGLNAAAHLLVASIPFLDKSSVEDFWEYNKKLFGNIIVGGLYSAIIFTGLSVAILAVDNLFELNFDGKIYAHLFVVVVAVFNTAFFLKNFPENFTFSDTQDSTYTPAIKNLSKYILIPIVAIYFLILYAYSIKILASWELPKGWVSSLVIGFSVAGIFTYLLNYYLLKYDDNALVKGFRKWFFFILFPMVILLFIGIGRRLADYGVTEERYVVAITGVWLLVISIYFMLSKKDNIKFIPISLAVFALLTVLGPFSAFRVSSSSQAGRLQELLDKNDMLKDGVAIPATDAISEADAESFRSILLYLREYGHYKAVAPMFPNAFQTDFPSWGQMDSLVAVMNLASPSTPKDACNLTFETFDLFNIEGFDQLQRINVSGEYIQEESEEGWTLSANQTSLQFKDKGEILEYIDLQPYLRMLSGKHKCYEQLINAEDAILEAEGNTIDVKLILETVTFNKGNTLKVMSLNGLIIMRKK